MVQQRVVLITGCSSGIGKALALEFHRSNYKVVATARKIESLDEIRQVGIETKPLDVNDAAQIKSTIAEVNEEFGGIDILVNNAGFGLMAPIVDVSLSDLRSQFETNVFAPLELSRAVIRNMRDRKTGLIVNIGSISGVLTTPFSGAYCASKAAIHALSDSLRMELKPFGIRVISVQPGAIISSFGESAGALIAKNFKQESWYQKIKHHVVDRASVSQKNATPVDEFSRILVSKLSQPFIPPVIRIGKLSTQLPFLSWLLPVWVTDKILARKFGLNDL